MPTRYVMYVVSVKWDATYIGYIIYFSNNPKSNSVDFAGYTTQATNLMNNMSIGLLNADDEVAFTSDPTTGQIFSMDLIAQVAKKSRMYKSEVYLVEVLSPRAHHGASVSAVFVVAMGAGLEEPHYTLFYTKSTIGPADGKDSLVQGAELTIIYGTDKCIHEVDVVNDLPEIVEKTVVSDPAKWTNLCVVSLMHVCGAADKTVRPSCHFWEHATTRINDCMYYRETMADACDCIAAHQHLQEHGLTVRTESVKANADESYDELLLQSFGRKV
jgi:hypothetical protein